MSHPSNHLSFEENQMVFSMLGGKKESLSTTVIQLLFATTTRPFQWQVQVTGVVCFVKDPIRKGFFIEVSNVSHQRFGVGNKVSFNVILFIDNLLSL